MKEKHVSVVYSIIVKTKVKEKIAKIVRGKTSTCEGAITSLPVKKLLISFLYLSSPTGAAAIWEHLLPRQPHWLPSVLRLWQPSSFDKRLTGGAMRRRAS